ncbi:protein of unknown function [Pararobbsia alpina]
MKLSLRLSFVQRLYAVLAVLLLAGTGVSVCLLVWVHDASRIRVTPTVGDDALDIAIWTLACVASVSLVVALVAIEWITRPLERLYSAMRNGVTFDNEGERERLTSNTVARATRPAFGRARTREARLAAVRENESAFDAMGVRMSNRWRGFSRNTRDRHVFAARLARDLHTPLASLNVYLDTITSKRETLGDNERRRYLGVALDQSRRVGALAHALFELERLEHGLMLPDSRTLDLGVLVREVLQTFELAAEVRNITLCAVIAPGVRPVRADIAMVERILVHLVDNAIRHTPFDGVIEIALDAAGDNVAVTISDTGPGISQDRIDALCRTSSQDSIIDHEPSGVGLLVVHRMLALHHSRMRLIERPGKGAVLRFELACAPEDAQKKTAI